MTKNIFKITAAVLLFGAQPVWSAQNQEIKIRAQIEKRSFEKFQDKIEWKTEIVCEKEATIRLWQVGETLDPERVAKDIRAIQCQTTTSGKEVEVAVGGIFGYESSRFFGKEQKNTTVAAYLFVGGAEPATSSDLANLIFLPGEHKDSIGFQLMPSGLSSPTPGKDHFTATILIGDEK